MDKISEQDEVRELSKNMELNIYNNKDNINENKYKEKKIQDLSELEEKNEQNFEYFPNYHFLKLSYYLIEKIKNKNTRLSEASRKRKIGTKFIPVK